MFQHVCTTILLHPRINVNLIKIVIFRMFHVSQLKKCLRVPEEQIPLEELTVKEDLTYEEFSVRILETA